MGCVTPLLLIACSLSFLHLCRAVPVLPPSISKADSLKFENVSNILINSGTSVFTCAFCKVVSSILRYILDKEGPEEEVARLIAKICIYAKYADQNVCNLGVEEFKDEILFVAYVIGLGRDKLACAILLGPSCEKLYDPWNQTEWNVAIPTGKPPVIPTPDPKPGSPTNRILHLSDIHWDQNYTEGLSNDCGEPICCRPPNKPGHGSTAAGKWGDYNCDLSIFALHSLMEFLAYIHDQFDWVYITGDLPAHNVWNQSRHDQITILNTISNLMKQYLPKKEIYFTFGNHESVPVDSFPPPSISGKLSNQWLLDAAAEAWGSWLSQQSLKDLKRGGFYNQKIRDGLRVISLQTNYANELNFWLLLDDNDPAGQLAWLVEQLLQAEKEGDKVHIIGHIPPASFIHSFGWNYHSIVNRFESTITGQFFGHTHMDSFELFFEGKRPTSIAYIVPSITTDSSNCGFRIYTLDGAYSGTSNMVLDYVNYFMNITEANLKAKPTWLKEYSAKADYSMSSLHPADWLDLVERFKTDDALFQRYYRYKYKLHPPSPTCGSCCKAGILCDLMTSRTGDSSACTDLLSDGVTMMDIEREMEENRGKC